MQLVEQHIIKRSNPDYKEIMELCHKSKNLYNASLYAVRQHYFETKKYLPYAKLDTIFKETSNPDYRSLPAQTAQQTMRMVDQNFKSFFSSLKREGKHHIPNYKDKDGYYVATYTEQQVRKKDLKEGYISLPGLNCKFKTCHNKINQVRFIPQKGYVVMEVVYTIKTPDLKENNDRYAAIDLGIDNLATLTYNIDGRATIINGKPLKSINQYYNKQKAYYQSIKATKKAKDLTLKRNNKIKDYFHKSSRCIVNQLVSNNVNTLIIGYNKKWKQDTSMGKVNNQSFTSIPHLRFVNMIKYKCELEGINVLIREESWTSKASALDNDYVPDLKTKDPTFSGERIKRGLYRSKHHLINADVNGSLNILRKAVGDVLEFNFSSPTDRGLVFSPYKVSF